MARRSLRWTAMACVLLASSGCVAPEPVDFQEPQQMGPFFDLANAAPPLTRLLNLKTGDPLNFTVSVRSEDRGELLIAPLWTDFDLVGGLWRTSYFALPSTLSDTSRSPLRVGWIVGNLTAGCHQITLFATHQSNYDEIERRPKQVKTDTAIAVWWALIDVDETVDGGTNFGPCPDPAPLGGDAGT